MEFSAFSLLIVGQQKIHLNVRVVPPSQLAFLTVYQKWHSFRDHILVYQAWIAEIITATSQTRYTEVIPLAALFRLLE